MCSLRDRAAVNDPCEHVDGCAPGLACVNAEFVPDCPGSGCCTPLCDVSEEEMCPSAGQLCLPWYEECGIPN